MRGFEPVQSVLTGKQAWRRKGGLTGDAPDARSGLEPRRRRIAVDPRVGWETPLDVVTPAGKNAP
jgi:hypothetical protein